MAIAEMSRMAAVCLSSEKEVLLAALTKAGAVELCAAKETPFTLPAQAADGAAISVRIERLARALEFLEEAKTLLPKGEVPKASPITLTVEEFLAADKRAAVADEALQKTEDVTARRIELKAEKAAAVAEERAYAPYLSVLGRFSDYADTKSACVFLGTVAQEKAAALQEGLAAIGAECSLSAGAEGQSVALCVAHKADRQAAEGVLSVAGFTRCPFVGDERASERVEGAKNRLRRIAEQERALDKEAIDLIPHENDLKLQLDYAEFLQEKARAEEGFQTTACTTVIEGYVPTQSVQAVKAQMEAATTALFVEFAVVPRTEFAPTLMQNKKATSHFEAVTNMYSVPAYGALDPNGAMAVFFSLFMGVIMGDAGYGLLMVLGGFWFAARQQKGSTVYRMAKVFAIGGFFAILFGALFDSFFGYGLLRATLGAGYNAFYAKYLDAIVAQATLAGITVPSILLWCLGLGTLHLAFGLFLNAAQCFGRKQYLQGFFGGIVWALALLSLVVWVFGMASGIAPLQTYGLYATAGLFILGILTAGIAEKGFGKVVKVFSSAYGIINYASDILSYARLYGLMLSGAQIASIFTNTLAIGLLFPAGSIGIAFGVIVIIVGNLFNLAMNLLGAFIHNSRLQYVEFFGKFYEGEGELFTPIGSQRRFVRFSAVSQKQEKQTAA